MSQYLAPQIVFLKQGTDTSQGRGQLISNMNACIAVVDIVRTTLGPLGMDKLIHSSDKKVTISNDGATIVKLLDIVHPAAKMLADISLSQDAEVGDGTTSVLVIAGEFLKNCKEFVEEGMHPRVIIRAYRMALEETMEKLKELAIDINRDDPEEHRQLLIRCARTALNSKLVSHYRDFFAEMVTDAVLSLDKDLDIGLVGVKKVQGGSIMDSMLVRGVAFKKTFSYAGFEQQPKKFVNPKIILLNIELELKSEKENAEVRVTSTQEYQDVVEAEWNIIYDKLDKIVASGAQVVLSRLAIGDLATQYFADRDIFCAGRVPTEDLDRVQRAVGGRMQTTVNKMADDVLGSCELFEEKAFGVERFNVFTGCPKASTATIIIRGGSEQFMAEAERSLHDAIMIVRRAIKHSTAVGGAGAIEMELSKCLREHAMSIEGREQTILLQYAKSLEAIPRTLADNAGHDSIDVLNKLRAKHAQGGTWYGVDLENGGICDAWENFIWEPALVKMNAISAATEAACVILSIDETVKNPAGEQEQMQAAGQLPGGGRGMPRMPGMPGGGRGRGMRMG